MSDLPAHNMLDEILSSLNSTDEIAVPMVIETRRFFRSRPFQSALEALDVLTGLYWVFP